MTDRDICPICGSQRIPGVSSCVSCGEPLERPTPDIQVLGPKIKASGDVSTWKANTILAREFTRRMTEGRSLEAARDVDGAMRIYEALLTGGTRFTPPFERLAILYGKAQRIDDEERVVRKALGTFSEGPSQWFIVRLAKILARRSARDSPKG